MRWLRPVCIRPDLVPREGSDFYRVSGPQLPAGMGEHHGQSGDSQTNGFVMNARPETPTKNSKAKMRHEVAYVELLRNSGESLGIIIAGGVDRKQPVTITNIRSNSVAKRSESLEVGDRILAVNGVDTSGLLHNDIVELLQASGTVVSLEIEYSLPEEAPPVDANVEKRQVDIRLRQKGGNFGLKLRGGVGDPYHRPLTFAHIVPQCDAYRQGLLKIGDRLLQVNGTDMTGKSIDDAMTKLKKSGAVAHLQIEYDVTIQDGLDGGIPILVELSKPAGVSLGITLSGSHTPGDPIIISQVRTGGLADRCGALVPGNRLLSINGSPLSSCTLPEAVQMLFKSDKVVRLEVLTGDATAAEMEDNTDDGLFDPGLPSPPPEILTQQSISPPSPSSTVGVASSDHSLPGSASAIYSHRGNAMAMPNHDRVTTPQSSVSSVTNTSIRERPPPPVRHSSTLSTPEPQMSVNSLRHHITSMQVCRQETVDVELQADPFGYGFSLQGGVARYESSPVTISSVEKDSPADRVGVLHVDDRVISINGTLVAGLTLEQVCKVIRESAGSMLLLMEFNVAEGVIPGSGTFDVKLLKQGSSLGITINSGSGGQSPRGLWISQVKKGGIAYRSGMVQAGDQLRAINGRSVEHCTLTQAGELLKQCGDIVTLQICKDVHIVGDPDSVVFTVELVRHGENLGITINGSNLPGEPVYVASIKEEGVAYKTGALQVGDCLLGINGHSLRDCALEDTVQLLQKAGDKITMQLRRTVKRPSQSGADGTSIASAASSTQIVTNGRHHVMLSPLRHQHSLDSEEALSDAGSPFSQHTSTSATHTPTHHADHRAKYRRVISASDSNGGEWRHTDRQTSARQSNSPAHLKQDHSVSQRARHASALKYISTGPQDSIDVRPRQEPFSGEVSNGVKSYSQNRTDATNKERNRISSASALRELESDLMESSNFAVMFGDRASSSVSVQSGVQRSTLTPDSSNYLHPPSPRPRGRATPIYGDRQSLDSLASKGSQATMRSVEFHVVELVRQRMASFGFSISDGQSQPGVYVRALQPSGAAERSGMLKPLDRIMQVNDVDVRDFDCRRTLPLLANAGISVRLVVCRCMSAHCIPELSTPH